MRISRQNTLPHDKSLPSCSRPLGRVGDQGRQHFPRLQIGCPRSQSSRLPWQQSLFFSAHSCAFTARFPSWHPSPSMPYPQQDYTSLAATATITTSVYLNKPNFFPIYCSVYINDIHRIQNCNPLKTPARARWRSMERDSRFIESTL